MSNRCIHKDEKGEQCPLMAETGLFCDIHTVAESKAAPRPRGGGGGGGRNMFRESLFQRYGLQYHHEPEDKKKDYSG